MEQTDNGELKEIDTSFLALLDNFADPCEDTVYHYTSAEGLQGIIENHELWLTNIEFVNDLEECKALQKDTGLFKESDFHNKEIWRKWESFCHPDKNFYHTDCNIYIFSFSEEADESLPQWRSYGNYRIGFDAKKLKKPGFRFYQCLYEKDEIIEWIVNRAELPEWKGLAIPGEEDKAARYLIDAASKKYKNKFFKGENEYRMIVSSDHIWSIRRPDIYSIQPPIHYRRHPAYKLPVPYVKFFLSENNKGATESLSKLKNKEYMEMKKDKLDKERTVERKLLPITEVMVGPMQYQNKAELACDILLKDNGYADVNVEKSEIPYRGF